VARANATPKSLNPNEMTPRLRVVLELLGPSVVRSPRCHWFECVFSFFSPSLGARSLLAATAVHDVRVPASAFFPANSGEGYFSFAVGGPRFGGDDGTVMQAPVQLPSGVILVSLELDFVEALYAAGLTTGCDMSPARFCPDQPVTRGQIAVFLSLGLPLP
jgi:hypothetical protein